jgi:hypothetical protein
MPIAKETCHAADLGKPVRQGFTHRRGDHARRRHQRGIKDAPCAERSNLRIAIGAAGGPCPARVQM